jgi:hypothetical protein
MKKLLAIIAVVGFAACNNGENKDANADSAAMADSAATTTMDTSAMSMDTTHMDTTHTADSTHK